MKVRRIRAYASGAAQVPLFPVLAVVLLSRRLVTALVLWARFDIAGSWSEHWRAVREHAK